MHDIDTLDNPIAKQASDAANDVLRALLRITNKHPVLAQGTPHRRELVRYIKRCVERGEAAMSLGVHIEISSKGIEYGFRTTDALKVADAKRFTLEFENNKFTHITEVK